MSDLLIRGMEMPEIENNHGIKAEIRMLDGKLELGIMTGGYYCSQEWTYYPLVEIPDHGDLIDRDELGEFPYNMDFCDGGEADEWVRNAPTVIPAR